MDDRKIAGIILSVIGLIGAIFGFSTISADKNDWLFGYTYTAPFTQHEILVISLVVSSLIALAIGLYLFFCTSQQNNNEKQNNDNQM